MYPETNMQQIRVSNSMHAPHPPEIEKAKGPKGLWPLGPGPYWLPSSWGLVYLIEMSDQGAKEPKGEDWRHSASAKHLRTLYKKANAERVDNIAAL